MLNRLTRSTFLGQATVALAALTIPQTVIAEPYAEVLHHLVSEGEVRALQIHKDALSEAGARWEDFAVGGEGGANSRQVLRTRIASGNPPGAMQFLGLEAVVWNEEGVLRSLSDIAEEENWAELIPKEFQSFLMSEGEWIAVPWNIHRQDSVFVNKPLFDKVSGEIPKNWDDIIALGKKFQDEGVVALALGGEGWQIMELFDALLVDLGGADFYRSVAANLEMEAIDSDQMREVFDYMTQLRGLVDDNFIGRDWAYATGMVINGDAAMQIHGDWAKAEFITAGQTPGEDFLCFGTPGREPNFVFEVDAYGMFKHPNEEATIGQNALARVTMQPEVQKEFNIRKGSIPARLDVTDEGFDICAQQNMKELRETSEMGTLVGSLSLGYTARPQFTAAFTEVVTEHFINGLSADEAIEMLKAELSNAM
jgi:glucose/mannose transport system substrate-binding protein